MLKSVETIKQLEDQAEGLLRQTLEQVPCVTVIKAVREATSHKSNYRQDIYMQLEAQGRPYDLVCEVLANGQPRHVRTAIHRLLRDANSNQSNTLTVIIAPYLSQQAQGICLDNEVGFLDLEGNCRLVFDGVYIERLAPARTQKERRVLRSIFSPKAAQVLRVLLRDPSRAWRVAELAEAAHVSLGHVSNVRKRLLDQEWAETSPDNGLWLTNPEALLQSWSKIYKSLDGKRSTFYSILHGSALQEAIKTALLEANEQGAAMLASYSAAQWLAAYARTSTQFFYSDEAGLISLQRHLKLTSTGRGENVIVLCPKNVDIFRDKVEPAPGIICTSPVQTYLDLIAAGERGREAAEHLKMQKLTWHR